jgi:hypothetical protein
MILVSLIINSAIFFLLLNFSYLQKKRQNPQYPNKPLSKFILFPLSLGIVFTIILDVFRGIIMYQMILFFVAAFLLYCFFYHVVKN